MMQPHPFRSVTAMLLAGAAIAAVGCGSDPMAEADAVLGPIEAAVANPTGTLGASNAKDVFTGAAMIGLFTQHGFVVPFEGTPSAPPLEGGDFLQCVDLGTASFSATYDLECISRGTTTGTQRWARASEPNARPRVEITEYDDVCSRSGSTCFSGKEALREGVRSAVRGRELEITLPGGETRVVRSGHGVEFDPEAGKGNSVISEAYVIFDETGRSYTLSAAPDVESGEVTVTGSNGTFVCAYSDRGEHGSCVEPTGEPAFDW